MENFYEQMVKHAQTQKDSVIGTLSIAAGAVLTLLTLLFLVRYFGILALAIIALIWYGALEVKRSRNIEYEYIFTGSMMDIDKIMSQKKRKRVVRNLNFKEISEMYPAELPETIPSGTNIFDYTGAEENRTVYCIEYFNGGEKNVIYFSPDKRALNMIKNANPRGVRVNIEDVQ